MIARVIAQRIERLDLHPRQSEKLKARVDWINAKEAALAKPKITLERTPYFCSGCPHNTSTNVPEGSRATAGIGCHVMAIWMDRKTVDVHAHGRRRRAVDRPGAVHRREAHLREPRRRHVLPQRHPRDPRRGRRQGQHHLQDPLQRRGRDDRRPAGRRPDHAGDDRAAGRGRRRREDRRRHRRAGQVSASATFAAGIEIHHRDELDAVQRELRDTPGCTVLLYDQTCAAEKRRRRKRGKYPDPAKRVFINELRLRRLRRLRRQVELRVGRAGRDRVRPQARRSTRARATRTISCVNGFCPSFVTVEGGSLRKPKKARRPANSRRCPSPRRPRRPSRTASSSPASAAPAWSPSARCSAWPRTSKARAAACST